MPPPKNNQTVHQWVSQQRLKQVPANQPRRPRSKTAKERRETEKLSGRDALIQGGVGKKQGTPRKGYSLRGCEGEGGGGSEREKRGGEERRVWRAEREEEWGFGNRRPGGAGAEGGRPLLADQPRRGRGGDDVASSFCKWHVLPPSLGKRSL